MTSTPVSLNDESLNGSWIDINSASQIHSPTGYDDDELLSPELLKPPHTLNASHSSFGLISFQVERFLRETNRNQNNSQQSLQQPQMPSGPATAAAAATDDNNSGIYLSDSDVSVDALPDSRTLMNSLKYIQEHGANVGSASTSNINNLSSSQQARDLARQLSNSRSSQKPGVDPTTDQLSDSLSLLSRASFFNDQVVGDKSHDFQDFDWLWDWTPQAEYFAGQEWKVSAPKHEYLMKQRQLYYAQMNGNQRGNIFSGDVLSLLLLTNLLSIIIGAGLTYSFLMKKSTT